jgi:hypothetical protein
LEGADSAVPSTATYFFTFTTCGRSAHGAVVQRNSAGAADANRAGKRADPVVQMHGARRARSTAVGREEEMMTSTRGALCTAAGMLCLLSARAAGAASIEIGSASGPPGADVTVTVSLRSMGAAVLGTQNRIDFDRQTPVAALPGGQPDCAVNPQINKDAAGFRFLPLGCDPAVDCQSVRVFVLSLTNLAAIPDQSVLYSCRIAIADDAALGAHPLLNREVGASAEQGLPVPTTGTDGAVEVVAAAVGSIDIGSASAAAGATTAFAVTFALSDPLAVVAGLQNDIGFDALTPIPPATDGRPACTVDPGIAKDATSFIFLPMGCTPGDDCRGVRAFVLSTTNTDPIADGATLYSCQVAVAADAPPGSYPLVAGMPLGSAPAAEILPVLASDGAVEVTEGPPPCAGDCDGDEQVAINELLVGVNIVIGAASTSVCTVLDVDADGTVAINELVRAVNNALNGCS